MTLPTEDQFSMTKDRAESILSYMMGGRVAEEIVFGHLTTGASNDIERATDLARKMVTEWGMSERLGPLNFASHNDNVFLGKELGSSTHFSAETSQLIDREIRDIVERNHKRAREVLMKHEKELHANIYFCLYILPVLLAFCITCPVSIFAYHPYSPLDLVELSGLPPHVSCRSPSYY